MIRHIVLCKFKSNLTRMQIEPIANELLELKTIIPQILKITGGYAEYPNKHAKGYNFAFTIDFENENTLRVYLDHPEHNKVADNIISQLENGIDGLIVLDYQI